MKEKRKYGNKRKKTGFCGTAAESAFHGDSFRRANDNDDDNDCSVRRGRVICADKKKALSVIPKQFGKIYIIASCVSAFLLIGTVYFDWQMAEHRTVNQGVTGSGPVGGVKSLMLLSIASHLGGVLFIIYLTVHNSIDFYSCTNV